MDNKELLILSALRNILFETDLDTKHLDNLKITRRIRDVLLDDCKMYDSYVNADGVIENIPIVDNIELTKGELNYFFMRAIQYAVPRQSYIVGVAREWAEEHLEDLTKETREKTIEIIENTRIPDDYDKYVWNSIRAMLGGQ